jgi:hypothetical protein
MLVSAIRNQCAYTIDADADANANADGNANTIHALHVAQSSEQNNRKSHSVALFLQLTW